ncbi:MAG: DUF1365 domain-containing protein [Alphaproteobacteria bacterium]|jgi:DUF1365 family protein|tara:strand:- start:1408 stop:2160 length:753 start_codon:yes stop_codon:yes gene_type:complete
MELTPNHSIGQGHIIHKRTRDTQNFFQYKAPYLCVNLNDPHSLPWFISLNKLNCLSIFYRQHGYREKQTSLFKFATDLAKKYQIDFHQVNFITIPSFLGYSFNPISFYLYLDHHNQLVSILYEVKNTFGDQVHYLSLKDFDQKQFKKNMYVSPFIEMDCTYKITVKIPNPHRFQCFINQYNKEKDQIFYASIDLPLAPLTKAQGFLFFLTNIFGSLKAIALIHVQALKLFFKKSNFFKYSQRIKDKLYLD